MKKIVTIVLYLIFLVSIPLMGLLFLAVELNSWVPAIIWAVILLGGNIYMIYKDEQPECDLYNPL